MDKDELKNEIVKRLNGVGVEMVVDVNDASTDGMLFAVFVGILHDRRHSLTCDTNARDE